MVDHIQIIPGEIIFLANVNRIYRGNLTDLIIVEFSNGKSVNYKMPDKTAATNVLLSIDGRAKTMTYLDTMNPPIFNNYYETPVIGLTPPDITRGCEYYGPGPTHYSWNPDTQSWIGIIVP